MNDPNSEFIDIIATAIMNKLVTVYREGVKAHLDGTANPYPGNTINHTVHCWGWVNEDLRQALMKANPQYREQQERFDARKNR